MVSRSSTEPPTVSADVTETFQGDPLGLLNAVVQKYDDIVRVPVGNSSFVLINNAEHIQKLLINQAGNVSKRIERQPATQRLLGAGLLTSEGDHWLRQRQLIQPAFHSQHMPNYGRFMVEAASEMVDEWSSGEAHDMAETMKQLTMTVAIRALFGVSYPVAATETAHAIDTIIQSDLRHAQTDYGVGDYEEGSEEEHKAVDHSLACLDDLVQGIISTRRASPKGDDFLSVLLDSAEQSNGISRNQLRDEMMSMLVAGHETTSLTLSWAWDLVSNYPSVQQRLQEELDTTIDGNQLVPEDLEKLPYTKGIVSETLRLFPPTYALGRVGEETVRLGPYEFAPDTNFVVSPWVMHRDERVFEDPLEFKPERWCDGLENRLQAGTYLPFGLGPRGCIGWRFAKLEAALVIATIAQRFSVNSERRERARPKILLTLRPEGGVPVVVHSRSASN